MGETMTDPTNTPEVTRHKAGVAHYRGDHQDRLGRVFGPLTYGGNVIAVGTTYDPEVDVTTVYFDHARADDPEPLPVGPVMPKRIVKQAWETLSRRALAIDWRAFR